jgi:hypothetical protein
MEKTIENSIKEFGQVISDIIELITREAKTTGYLIEETSQLTRVTNEFMTICKKNTDKTSEKFKELEERLITVERAMGLKRNE